jgi:adenylate cyclase
MSEPWQLSVYENQQLVYSTEVRGAVELGRQSAGEPGPYAKCHEGGRCRIIIARFDEDIVSRHQVLLEPLGNTRTRLTNLSTKRAVGVDPQRSVEPGESLELSGPLRLMVGTRVVRFQKEANEVAVHGMGTATRPPGTLMIEPVLCPTLAPGAGLDTEALIRWLQSMMDLLHSAATSFDFFQKAAQALVDMVGLETGRVLLHEGDGWKVAAAHTPPPLRPDQEWHPSRKVLEKLHKEKATFWQPAGGDQSALTSLVGLSAVVAAPILDRQGEIIGTLYGERRQGGIAGLAPNSLRVQALLVELLAMGVAAGLARLEQERAAVQARVQFEQFFSPELAHHLAGHRDLLEGRDAEVTVLFSDIRGFSRISEKLGPARTVDWVRDVFGVLSEAVHAHQGVLVDYIGDELMAMWGAPEEQPDHPRRACLAALDMLERLPELNGRWQEVLGEPVGVSIGVNTGVARVGNIGSAKRFKYGPLGNMVNLASRVQGAAKYLQTWLLITDQTRARLDGDFAVRRLSRVRVVHIAEAVDLFELVPPGRTGWAALKSEYEKALGEFERGEFRIAARILGNLLAEYPDDGPALVLMSRTVEALVGTTTRFDPVWTLPGK